MSIHVHFSARIGFPGVAIVVAVLFCPGYARICREGLVAAVARRGVRSKIKGHRTRQGIGGFGHLLFDRKIGAHALSCVQRAAGLAPGFGKVGTGVHVHFGAGVGLPHVSLGVAVFFRVGQAPEQGGYDRICREGLVAAVACRGIGVKIKGHRTPQGIAGLENLGSRGIVRLEDAAPGLPLLRVPRGGHQVHLRTGIDLPHVSLRVAAPLRVASILQGLVPAAPPARRGLGSKHLGRDADVRKGRGGLGRSERDADGERGPPVRSGAEDGVHQGELLPGLEAAARAEVGARGVGTGGGTRRSQGDEYR
mmetsp:Transcript_31713/g.72774  ORF Transcript_31713/g.72774 Transcript_31713/m.72774 type:complete len:308 (-) Transcript_31713:77-1000(-)